MTYWLVLSLAVSCPSDGTLWGRFIPLAKTVLMKAGACSMRPEAMIEANKSAAVKKLTEIGPGVRLLKCVNLRCKEIPVKWENKMRLEES